MNNSASHAMSTTVPPAELSRAPQHFQLFNRPDFVAAVNNFREHFGLEVRSKTTEGYTFLGRDRHAPPARVAPPRRSQPTHGASPADSNTSHASPAPNPTGISNGQRGPAQRAPAVATTTPVSQREEENTLDSLLNYMKRSPQSVPNTARGRGTAGAAAGSVFQKTVVVSQAQSRLDTLNFSLPTHLAPAIPALEQLFALRAGISRLAAQAEERQQMQQKNAVHENGHENEPRSRVGRPGSAHEPPSNSGDRPPKKRALGSAFVFQIQVPKKARRNVIDAIVATSLGKRQTSTSADNVRAGPKRARKQPASSCVSNGSRAQASSPPSTPPQSMPPSPYTAAQRSSPVRNGQQRLPPDNARAAREPSRSNTRSRSKSRAPSRLDSDMRSSQSRSESMGSSLAEAPGLASSMTEAEIERLRRQSARLETLMRAFKHGGDAEREPGGRVELMIGYYLESLACCLEDFWGRRVWQAAGEVRKNWSTMLDICRYVYRRCTAPELATQRGCAALIAAAVHYQMASAALDTVRQTADADDAVRAARDASTHMSEIKQYEQGGMLAGAACLARQFPRTWQRCQEVPPTLGAFELRSQPNTRRWPAVAYPVGAASNPLDVANLVRQVNCEWLERCGLSLQVPAN
ncbi:hypothetical protein IW147_004411 [Coemansia sp. RSA 720]|nr:hypothetical protein IW147_004411 [Coemansia sp. RSA 720]